MKFTRICPDCKKELFHTSKNNRNHLDKLQRPCVHCGRIRMMNREGYWDKIENTKQIISKKFTGAGNPNFGLSMTDNQKEKLRKNAKRLYGKDNLSYGKSTYQWWIEKYGIDVANQKMEETKKKWSQSSVGENNPMYGKPSPNGSGNGWSGWYNNWFFRSIHELSYMVNVIEKNGWTWESGEQKKYKISYTDWEGKIRNYFPDFIVNGNVMVECKPKKLHNSVGVVAKKNAAEIFCCKQGLTFSIECPILLITDEIKNLYDGGKIKFLPRYEKMFLEKYGKT